MPGRRRAASVVFAQVDAEPVLGSVHPIDGSERENKYLRVVLTVLTGPARRRSLAASHPSRQEERHDADPIRAPLGPLDLNANLDRRDVLRPGLLGGESERPASSPPAASAACRSAVTRERRPPRRAGRGEVEDPSLPERQPAPARSCAARLVKSGNRVSCIPSSQPGAHDTPAQ